MHVLPFYSGEAPIHVQPTILLHYPLTRRINLGTWYSRYTEHQCTAHHSSNTKN